MHPGRSVLALWVAMTIVTVARAEDDACLSAYDSSQRHKRAGELLLAREKLLVCAQEDCPAPVAKECTQWLREVNAVLPSVVFAARDRHGNDLTRVKVLDGDRVLTERLDGREIALDPGPHVFRFEFSDKRALTRRVLIRQAQKNRLIEVVEPPRPATRPTEKQRTRPEEPSAGPPVLAIVLASVGVLGLASFTYFGLDAKSDVDDFQRCKPDCNQSEVDAAQRKALVADVSLAVGVVSLGAAGWLWFSDARSRNASTPQPSAGSLGRFGLSIAGRF